MDVTSQGSCNEVSSSMSGSQSVTVSSEIVILAPVPPSRYEEALARAVQVFLEEEALCRCFPPCPSGARVAALRATALDCLRSGLCAVALAGQAGPVVGACFSQPLEKHRVIGVDVHTMREDEEDPQEKHIVRFLTSAHQRLDLFSALAVPRLLDMALLYVDPAHRGRGIAKRLLQANAQLAARHGLLVAKGDATSLTSARVFQKSGFVQVYSMPFTDYKSDGEVVFANTAPPNDRLRIYVGCLKPEEPYIIPPEELKLDTK